MLPNANADLNVEGGQYRSALQAVAMKGRIVMVELLLEKKAKDFTEGGRKRWDQATNTAKSAWIGVDVLP